MEQKKESERPLSYNPESQWNATSERERDHLNNRWTWNHPNVSLEYVDSCVLKQARKNFLKFIPYSSYAGPTTHNLQVIPSMAAHSFLSDIVMMCWGDTPLAVCKCALRGCSGNDDAASRGSHKRIIMIFLTGPARCLIVADKLEVRSKTNICACL